MAKHPTTVDAGRLTPALVHRTSKLGGLLLLLAIATPFANTYVCLSETNWDYNQSKLDTCWTPAKFQLWKTCGNANEANRSSDPLIDIYLAVITGVLHHRNRADLIMCTWGKIFHPENLQMYSDSPDARNMLPVIDIHTLPLGPYSKGGLPEGSMTHKKSQSKFVLGFIDTLRRGMARVRPVKWYMMGDDDTFIFPHNLVHLTHKYDPDGLYLLARKYNGNFFGGAGFVISRSMAPIVLDLLETDPTCHCDIHSNSSTPCYYDVQLPSCIQRKLGTKMHFIDHVEFYAWNFEGLFTGAQGGRLKPQVTLHYMNQIDSTKYIVFWRTIVAAGPYLDSESRWA